MPTAFGNVDFDSEHGIFHINNGDSGICRLTLIGRTERGFPRLELANLPGSCWEQIAHPVQNELTRELGVAERGSSKPKLVIGDNGLSPLVTRELAVLLWALMEDENGTHTDALITGWRQLAREERWWLYARASGPAQKLGQGWRRALFFALTDPADTRTAPRLHEIMEAASDLKKNPRRQQIGSSKAQKENDPQPKVQDETNEDSRLNDDPKCKQMELF